MYHPHANPRLTMAREGISFKCRVKSASRTPTKPYQRYRRQRAPVQARSHRFSPCVLLQIFFTRSPSSLVYIYNISSDTRTTEKLLVSLLLPESHSMRPRARTCPD